MNDVLIAYAPYVSLIIGALVSLATFVESKRKTQHDELHDLYDEIKADNDRLRKENDELKKELDKKNED
ncbi:hypothetical protein [Lapidilactobacillus dextrinicus]|uniref:hypothetical protein n=1 Tax=Lapidilactobacillus dextrinicus TaxID=51664 RepID=UPI003F210F8A